MHALDQMGLSHLLDEMGLDRMGLDKVGYLCYPLLLHGEQGLVYALQMYYFLCL